MVKKIALFILILIVNFANIFGQKEGILSKKITLKVKKVTFLELLKEIELKSEIKFSFYQKSIPEGKFSFNFNKEELSDVLAIVFQPQSLIYSVLYGNNFVITKQENKIKKFTISGFVYDEKTGEKLIGVNIYNVYSLKNTTTNQDGFYSLTLEEDSIYLVYSYIGFINSEKHKLLNKNISENIYLESSFFTFSAKVNSKTDNTKFKPDEIHLSIKTFKQFPVLFGEVDVLKSLQLLPGVNAGNDGTTGLNIRGGSPDQNLILLDDVPVYNPSHLYGFISIFNSDVVQDVGLIKGGISARYGGRLSSVIDVRTIDGNKKKLKVQASIGFLSSKITLDGPLPKNKKTTVVLSIRRTYLDVLSALTKSNLFNNQFSNLYSEYYFYDANAKLNHRFNKNHQLTLSFYSGIDNSYLKNSFSLKTPQKSIKEKDRQSLFWGNTITSFRYNHVISPKIFGWFLASNSTYNFGNISEYSYSEKNDSSRFESNYDYNFNSKIRDWIFSYNFEYKPFSWLSIKSGSGFIFHKFERKVIVESNTIVIKKNGLEALNAIEFNGYTEFNFKITRKLGALTGLHYTHYNLQGVQYALPQPRLNLNYKLNKNILLHAGYASTMQFLHLLTNSNASGIPIDLWLPSTQKIKPEKANIVSGGISYNKGNYLINIEVFNKNMMDLIEYKDQVNYLGSDNNWEDKILTGKGLAYGVEFLAEKRNGKTNGWVSYTWSKNYRQFDNINNGKVFPYKYDRRHNISFVLTHEFSKKIDANLTWVYASGANATLPKQLYYVNSATAPNNAVFIYGERNAYKFPNYHRMDISINAKKIREKYTRVWSFGAYNIYNRWNAFYITPAYNSDGKREFQLVSLFPFLPSINYKIAF